MKISRGEITITDVPGVDYIKVNTEDSVVSIKLVTSEYPISYEHVALVHLRDALTVAIDAMTDENSAAGVKPTESTSPTAEVGDVFTTGDDEPSNILKVIDSEGDIWEKARAGEYHHSHTSGSWMMWKTLVNAYGPLTVTEVSE